MITFEHCKEMTDRINATLKLNDQGSIDLQALPTSVLKVEDDEGTVRYISKPPVKPGIPDHEITKLYYWLIGFEQGLAQAGLEIIQKWPV